MENFISIPTEFVSKNRKQDKFLQEAIDAGYDTAFIVSFDNGKRLDWKKL